MDRSCRREGDVLKIFARSFKFRPENARGFCFLNRAQLGYHLVKHRHHWNLRLQLASCTLWFLCCRHYSILTAIMAHPIHREIQQPRLNYEQVRALISSEPSCASLPDRQNGYTPLHTAARRGDPQLIRVLIECGAELEARIAGSGQTPFLIACQVSHCGIK